MPSNIPLPIGVNTMSFMWRYSARDAMELIAAKGYRKFELMAHPPHLDPFMGERALDVLAKFIRDTGLTVETINLPSLDQNLPAPRRRCGTTRCVYSNV